MARDDGRKSDVAAKTRQVYADIHERQIVEGTEKRLPGYVELLNLDVSGLRCLDFGAGSTGRDAIRLLTAGAVDVVLVDVGYDWMDIARRELERAGFSPDQYSFAEANNWLATAERDQYDFIACNGVLHHVENPDAVMAVIAASLRPSAHFFLSVIGKGGILRDFVMHTLRDHYASNDDFRAFMNGEPDEMVTAVRGALHSLAVDRDRPLVEPFAQLLSILASGIDVDLVLTLKDRINSPIYREYNMEMAEEMLKKYGLTPIQRIYTAPEYGNLRMILEPVYAHPDRPLSRALMGSGDLHLLARKAK